MDTEVLKKNAKAFIDENPVSILLDRREKVDDGAGGWKWGPFAPLAEEQTFRWGYPSTTTPVQNRATSAGEVTIPERILIGVLGSDIRRWDQFTEEGQKWEVVHVSHLRWSLHAEVVQIG